MAYTKVGSTNLNDYYNLSKYGANYTPKYTAYPTTVGGKTTYTTPTAPTASTAVAGMPDYQKLAEDIVSKVKTTANKGFAEILPFNRYFNSDLARQAAKQRAEGYYNPIQQQGLSDIREQAARRGIFRSGIRQNQEQKYNADIADQLQSMLEQLYNIREQEAAGKYALEQQRYEQDPTGYQIPAEFRTPVGQQILSDMYQNAETQRISPRDAGFIAGTAPRTMQGQVAIAPAVVTQPTQTATLPAVLQTPIDQLNLQSIYDRLARSQTLPAPVRSLIR